MNGRRGDLIVVVLACGLISAAVFGLAADPLSPLGLMSVSFWIAAPFILASGLLGSLVLVDLKRTFLAAPLTALLAASLYSATLMAPAATMSHYANHLWSYALVQSIPVLVITMALVAIGAMAGTIINTSVREFDL